MDKYLVHTNNSSKSTKISATKPPNEFPESDDCELKMRVLSKTIIFILNSRNYWTVCALTCRWRCFWSGRRNTWRWAGPIGWHASLSGQSQTTPTEATNTQTIIVSLFSSWKVWTYIHFFKNIHAYIYIYTTITKSVNINSSLKGAPMWSHLD